MGSFRLAFRRLSKSPGYAAAAVFTLAFAVALNTFAFSVLDAMLLRDPPYGDPARLVGLQDMAGTPQSDFLSPAEAQVIARDARSFAEVAAYRGGTGASLALQDESGAASGVAVTPNVFHLLAVRAERGRALAAGDERATGALPVVISHGLWKQRFSGVANPIGQPFRASGQVYTVVGVMPEGFSYPAGGMHFWVPLQPSVSDASLSITARLRPGVTIEQGRVEAVALLRGLDQARAAGAPPRTARVATLRELSRSRDGVLVVLLQAVVGCIVLITSANVSTLALMRALARRREDALRLALGASSRDLLKPVWVEACLLAGAAASIGVAAALGTMRWVAAMDPVGRGSELAVGVASPRHLLVAAAIGIVAALLCSLGPVLQSLSLSPAGELKAGGSGVLGRSRSRTRGALVTGQIALAVLLLVNTASLVAGVRTLMLWKPTADVGSLYSIRVRLRGPDPRAGAVGDPALARIADALRHVPGVTAVGASAEGADGRVRLSDAIGPGADCDCARVDAGFLQAAGMRMVRGRAFTDADDAGAHLAIVDERMARRVWGARSPVGQPMVVDWGSGRLTAEVVGVAAHAELVPPRQGEPAGQAWLLSKLDRGIEATVWVRGRPGMDLTDALRGALSAADPSQKAMSLRSVEVATAAILRPMRWYVAVVSALSLIALVIAAVGLYGIVSYSTARRTPELALRMALGARPRSVATLVLRGALWTALGGVALGGIAGIAFNRVLATGIIGMAPLSATAFLAIAAIMAAAIVVATMPSLVRGVRVHPADALRSA